MIWVPKNGTQSALPQARDLTPARAEAVGLTVVEIGKDGRLVTIPASPAAAGKTKENEWDAAI
jgi:hypothetical protein